MVFQLLNHVVKGLLQTGADHKLFELLGAVLGKVLFEKITLESHFDHTFLRQLIQPLGK